MAKLQVQQPNGEWKEFASCADSQASVRLGLEAQKYMGRRIRAVSDKGSVIDIL